MIASLRAQRRLVRRRGDRLPAVSAKAPAARARCCRAATEPHRLPRVRRNAGNRCDFRGVTLTQTSILYVDDVIDFVTMLQRSKRAGSPNKAWRSGNLAGRRPSSSAGAVGGPVLSNGLYWLYEVSHAALQPARAFADVTELYFKNPLNPLAHTTYGKTMAAAAELFERSTRRYGQAGMGHRFRHWSAASARRSTSRRCGSGRSAGCCISSACSVTCRAGRSRSC